MNDKDQADILRLRWRSELHLLNEDADGHALCNQMADVMELYHNAKDAARPLKARMQLGAAVQRLENLGLDTSGLDGAIEEMGGTVSEEEYYNSTALLNYRLYHGQVLQLRRFWRGVREYAGAGWIAAHTFDNFSEPSDEELLATAGGDA